MLKNIAIIYGIVFIIIGILGFVTMATPGGYLLGVFLINTPHNLVPLFTGLIALWIGISRPHGARLFFQIFGFIYALLAILGFIGGDQAIFGVIANNKADSWLHLLIAIITLYFGFGLKVHRARKK
jgi:hypothetical protein